MDPGATASPGNTVLIGFSAVTADLGVMLYVFLLDMVHHTPVAIGEEYPSAEREQVLDLDIGLPVIIHHSFSTGDFH
jgi:hypothetical protein